MFAASPAVAAGNGAASTGENHGRQAAGKKGRWSR